MLWIARAQPATAVMPCAIGTKMNWPNEPPALTMPVAMPRLAGGARRAVADKQHRMDRRSRRRRRQNADRDDEPERRRHQRHERGAEADQHQAAEENAPGAVAVGDHAGERLRQAPPKLADAEGEADARQAEAGRRIDDAQKEAHRLARTHRDREDAAGGKQDEAVRDRRARAPAAGAVGSGIGFPSSLALRVARQSSQQRVQRGDAVAPSRSLSASCARFHSRCAAALGAAARSHRDLGASGRPPRGRPRPSRRRPAAAGCGSASRRPSPSPWPGRSAAPGRAARSARAASTASSSARRDDAVIVLADAAGQLAQLEAGAALGRGGGRSFRRVSDKL